jgi:CHAD domain-containing protein
MIMVVDYIKLKDIKPTISGYISESLSLLRKSEIPDEIVVHDIRVLMKKTRSALKLLRSQVDAESIQRDYLAFRETGRMLAEWREISVHRKTFKALRKENSGLFSRLAEYEKIRVFFEKEGPQKMVDPLIKTGTELIDATLNKALYRIRFLSVSNLDAGILLRELEITYNIVCFNYLVCRDNPKAENIHKFRKKSKDFLYQLFFFRSLNPAVVRNLEKQLDILTQNLGKYNDLSQILRYLEYKPGDPANTPAVDELILVLKNKQDNYLSKVWPIAFNIFCPGHKLLNMLGFRLLVI